MTFETLITFLTIENNNKNNYIVTFEYRVMVTAFAILAMFIELMFSIQLLKSPGIVYKELGIPSVILGRVLL